MANSSPGRKAALEKRWSEDSNFHLRVQDREIAEDANAIETLSQIKFLLTLFPNRYTRLVEIGSGDGKLLDLIQRRSMFQEVAGSDLPGHRLDRAIADFPNLALEVGDALSMGEKYADERTLFLAFNVLGNLVRGDLELFLQLIRDRGSALAFCAGGLPLDTSFLYADRGLALSYNYGEFARRFGLSFASSLHRYRENGKYIAGTIGTLVPLSCLSSHRSSIKGETFEASTVAAPFINGQTGHSENDLRRQAKDRILVTGQMRSGTTMLASFLNAQKGICLVPDCLRIPAASLNAFGKRIDPDSEMAPVSRERLWNSLLHIALNNPATPPEERAVLEGYKIRNQRPPFINHTELYLRLLGDIAQSFPPGAATYYGTKATRGESLALSLGKFGAKAIIILRDPRAVFASQEARAKSDKNFVTVELDSFIGEWKRSYSAWKSADETVLTMRYEDFVMSDQEFPRLSEYLGVEIRPDVKIATLNTSFEDTMTGQRRPGPVDRWKEHGSPNAISRISEALRSDMEDAGYS